MWISETKDQKLKAELQPLLIIGCSPQEPLTEYLRRETVSRSPFAVVSLSKSGLLPQARDLVSILEKIAEPGVILALRGILSLFENRIAESIRDLSRNCHSGIEHVTQESSCLDWSRPNVAEMSNESIRAVPCGLQNERGRIHTRKTRKDPGRVPRFYRLNGNSLPITLGS